MNKQAAGSRRRFHLVRLIGAGAFGEVYLAEQDSGAGFKRKVAIKLLNSDTAHMKEAGRRMRDEARILGRLSHRHIVTVLDLIRLGDRWAVLMDFVPGADIEQVIVALERRGDQAPLPASLEIGAAILRAVHAAYYTDDGRGGTLQVVHRDIKPSNVRLTDDGELKVLDFGVARVSMDTREAKTRATGWMGTERYMAPERILCEGDTLAGDVYAATATVLELLLLRPLGRTPVLDERHTPFVNEALDALEERLTELDPSLQADLRAALFAGLSTYPKDRPSPSELADTFDALARRAQGEPLGAFSRRFVPLVDQLLGHRHEPATGILVEGSEDTIAASGVEATFIEESPPKSTTRTPKKALPPWIYGLGVLAALAVTGGLVLGGVAAVSAFQLSQVEAPQTPEPKPAEPEPTPKPPPAEVIAAPEPLTPPVEVPPEVEPPVAPAPVVEAPPPAPVTKPKSAPTGPRITKAQLSLPDAASLKVTCGDRTANGTASVRITDFYGETCSVQALYLGKTYTSDLTIAAPRGFTCQIAGDKLQCK